MTITHAACGFYHVISHSGALMGTEATPTGRDMCHSNGSEEHRNTSPPGDAGSSNSTLSERSPAREATLLERERECTQATDCS